MTDQKDIYSKLIPGINDAPDRMNYLNSLASKYPYYAAAQLAHVKEQPVNNETLTEAKQRAALVWHPLLLEQLLLAKTITEEEIEIPQAPSMKAEPVSDDAISEFEQNTTSNQSDNPSDIIQNVSGTDELVIDQQFAENEEHLQTGSVMDIAASLEEESISGKEAVSSVWEEREELENSLSEEMVGSENKVEIVSKEEQPKSDQSLPGIFSTEKFQELMTPHKSLSDIINEENAISNPTAETKYTEILIPEKEVSFTEPTSSLPEPLLFEPLHTSDYFASQGIKLSEEQIPADRLGKQLKSFTQWLQTMKSVHPIHIDLKTVANQEVTNLAEKSNEEEDVITESMAIAYIAQGKPQKAADIYEKLKLIYPHKSAYFAAELVKLS